MLANALAQKYDVRYKSDGEINKESIFLIVLMLCFQESKELLSVLTWAQPTPAWL